MEAQSDLSKPSSDELRCELKRRKKFRNGLLAAFPGLENREISLTQMYEMGREGNKRGAYEELIETERQIERLTLELLKRGQGLDVSASTFKRKANRKKPGARSTPAKPIAHHRDKFLHGPDYRSIVFQGKQYTLTANQAHVVETLHKAHDSGTPDVSAHTILEELETPNSRLRDTFKRSVLWGTLIVQGGKKGTYRLSLPVTPKKPAF